MWIVPAARRVIPIALAVMMAAPLMAAPEAQRQVLVLYSTRRDVQVAVMGDRELPRILQAGLRERLDFYSEYIDLGRLSAPGYRDGFRDFLRLKYKEVRFDLVIAIQDVAVQFVADYRDQLFPGTPVVFVAAPSPAGRIANSTGLSIPLHLADTVRLAAGLQPGLREVFVVTGADPRDRVYEQLAREQLKQIASPPQVTFLAGLPIRELDARVQALPADAAVYYLLVNRDGDGNSFHPIEYLEHLSKISTAPVYSWVDSTIGHGIVGGSLKSLEAQTEAVGQLALRVLRGEPADSIPVAEPDLNVIQVDWRELKRRGISESRVPAGTTILFRQPSLWDRYRVYVIGAIALFLAQTALIAGLLVHRLRRRQAERELRRSEATLRDSYDRIRDLGSRLLTAQDEERARLARELHDDISQQLAMLTIDLDLLSRGHHPEEQAIAREALERTQEVVRSMHDLSHRLHPARLQLLGLVPALSGLQREGGRSDTPIRFVHTDVPATLPPETTLTLFRIAQEALHNALKYSKAREIAMRLECRDGRIVLTIEDDGVGFDIGKEWGKGLGLVSIGERLEAIGGALEMHSTPGRGTRVSVAVPLGEVAGLA